MARILVVEDDELVRRFVVAVLAELGNHSVADAESGDAAVALLGNGFDLIVTDIKMPGRIDGIALARLATRENPPVPVLCMTGYSADYVGLPLLRKPFKPTVLLQQVERVLADVKSSR